jgi:hypothetical protein
MVEESPGFLVRPGNSSHIVSIKFKIENVEIFINALFFSLTSEWRLRSVAMAAALRLAFFVVTTAARANCGGG